MNLGVFLFVMTGMIFVTQHRSNPEVSNYADALYFAVTALTTTGFGDILLTGTAGRLLAVIVMIAGVTLFLRLAQVLFRPRRVRHACPICGLDRHDADAIHCNECGTTLNFPTEGMYLIKTAERQLALMARRVFRRAWFPPVSRRTH